ncbi:HAD family hydrolase [Chloroflexota bacterium]
MRHKAVLFDLDGTLLDTLQDIADSVNLVLERLGFPQHEVDAYRYFVGDGREILASRVLPGDKRDADTIDMLDKYIGEEYAKRQFNNARPYPGIPGMLDSLTDLGIKMAILTNKPEDSTGEMVKQLLSRWHFETVVGASSSVPRKPDPTGALRIAKQLSLPPTSFLYLGDSDVDMKTAKAAGMYPLGALWGFCTADELLANGAVELVHHPLDLIKLL